MQKVREAEIKADKVVDANLAEYEKEIDRAIDQWTRGFSGLSLQESSESTHEIGHSASLSTPLEADGEKSGTTLVPSSPK